MKAEHSNKHAQKKSKSAETTDRQPKKKFLDVEEIDKYAKKLIGQLTFTADYNALVNGTERLLIVEGRTDQNFVEKKLEEDVACWIADKAFGQNPGTADESYRCKKAIMQVIYGMSKLSGFMSVPKTFQQCMIYGMVDLDAENVPPEFFTPNKLFVTDTHDLETLLMSTDEGILQRLNGGMISKEVEQKAFYLAYQIGVLRSLLFEYSDPNFKIKVLSGGSNEIDFRAFVQDYRINLAALIRYINEKNDNHISPEQEKKLAGRIAADKRMKKKLDADGNWKGSWESFECAKVEDFWTVVNGHDILQLLKFLLPDIAQRYGSPNMHSLNRKFEMDLIENYQYVYFNTTKLYGDMRREKVVTE